MIKTKIVCTIGPAVSSIEKILELMDAGMDVARLNFSHGTHEEHLSTINLLKEARNLRNKPLAIMLDTKGPEIRLGKIEGGSVKLKAKQKWFLSNQEIIGNNLEVTLYPADIAEQLQLGTQVFFGNGHVASIVIEKSECGCIVEIQNSGTVHSGNGVNIPNAHLKLPAVTQKDIEDIEFGCLHGIDAIAASFIGTKEQILTLKEHLSRMHGSDILIFAKIETPKGVENFDSILEAADGIMVARGDLGIEVPLSQVPRLQKMMIRRSNLAGKPVVTATQMLESMIHHLRPTRAEVSDVANAIYDSSTAVMLSGETAVGLYPIETVNMMSDIIREAEADFNYRAYFDQHMPLIYQDIPSAVTLAAVNTAYSAGAQAIFAFTSSGTIARLLSRLRPKIPIIALTWNLKTYHQMAFDWGVTPVFIPECQTFKDAFEKLSAFAIQQRFLRKGDRVVAVSGAPFSETAFNNMMFVENIS